MTNFTGGVNLRRIPRRLVLEVDIVTGVFRFCLMKGYLNLNIFSLRQLYSIQVGDCTRWAYGQICEGSRRYYLLMARCADRQTLAVYKVNCSVMVVRERGWLL
jgi:hypothetical protein